jgi:ADP-ribose pyrophosphatase YjhB (NUDIX family)
MRRRSLCNEWMPERLWRQVKRSIPIACVDVLLENSKGEILLGWRKIPPYSNVWATPGGRLYRGESLRGAADRILSGYGLRAGNLFLVGVFPIRFPTRADVVTCLASNRPIGKATPDGFEFSKFRWTKNAPSETGSNYASMILRWRQLRRNADALRFAAIHG